VISILNLSDKETEFELLNELKNDQLFEIFTDEQITTQYIMQPWGYKIFSNK